MNREIKFRAWNFKSKKMFHDEFFVTPDGEAYSNYGADMPFDVELMQYTGLKDRNGVEIYEGDIVVIGSLEGSPLGAVEYDLDWGAYNIKDNEKYQFGGERVCIYTTDRFEVIGNIYENPDLLTQKP